MSFILDNLSLEEQALLLEEAALVYYRDEETDEVEYACDESDDDESLSDNDYDYAEEIRIAGELETIFSGRFTEPKWKVCDDKVVPVELGDFPKKHDRKIKWKNSRIVPVRVMPVADIRLPHYSSRKYPKHIHAHKDENDNVHFSFDDAVFVSRLNISDELVKSVNKDCIAFKVTGTCRFMNKCVYRHNYTSVKQARKKAKRELERKTKSVPAAVVAPTIKPTVKSVPTKSVPTKIVSPSTRAANVSRPPKTMAPTIKPIVKSVPADNKPMVKPAPTKKIFMCKNIIAGKECKFGDTCRFSHSREELEFHIRPCNQGSACKSVIRHDIAMVRNGQMIKIVTYDNNKTARCPAVHPSELTANYIKRLAMN